MSINALTDHLIPLQGALNVRDLGGYPSRKGLMVHKNRFVRGASLSHLTEEDIQILYSWGITLILDLRSAREVHQAPDALGKNSPFAYSHVEMFDNINSRVDWDDNTRLPASLGELYCEFLDASAHRIREVFQILAREKGCVLFHCTAGKDRTGIIAMLLLDLAGVDRETILADYSITQKLIAPMFRNEISDSTFAYLFHSERQNMEKAMDHLYKKWGGAKAYLQSIGLSREYLIRLIEKLLGS